MNKAKTCPFCGGRAKLEKHIFSGASDSFGVKCTKCSAETWQFYGTEEDALCAWNTRTDHNRAKWIGVSPFVDTLQCSECGYQIINEELKTPYCPWCGAEMEVGAEADNE